MKHRFAVLLVLVVLMSSLVGGFMGGSVTAGTGPSAASTSPNQFLSEFTEALDLIEKNHVDNIKADKLGVQRDQGHVARARSALQLLRAQGVLPSA